MMTRMLFFIFVCTILSCTPTIYNYNNLNPDPRSLNDRNESKEFVNSILNDNLIFQSTSNISLENQSLSLITKNMSNGLITNLTYNSDSSTFSNVLLEGFTIKKNSNQVELISYSLPIWSDQFYSVKKTNNNSYQIFYMNRTDTLEVIQLLNLKIIEKFEGTYYYEGEVSFRGQRIEFIALSDPLPLVFIAGAAAVTYIGNKIYKRNKSRGKIKKDQITMRYEQSCKDEIEGCESNGLKVHSKISLGKDYKMEKFDCNCSNQER